jgi:MOSC domain-containing protein YiiM
MTGTVIAINLTAVNGTKLQPVQSVRAVAGQGLEGDRYFGKTGRGRNLTLIEAEALEALQRDYKLEVTGADTRRNIVTRGVALNHLVGREFTVGKVRLCGVELCEPCGHLAKLTQDKVREALIHRGGLNCDVLTEGKIHVGDFVELQESTP